MKISQTETQARLGSFVFWLSLMYSISMTDNHYIIPVGTAEFKLTEKASKFLGYAAYVETESAAEAIILSRSKKYFDASHHCRAYRVGDPLHPNEKFTDAGEPSGTAGRPILDQIRRSGLVDIVVVVTRWFGGTKLGKGGLVRAYGECAAGTLAVLKTETRRIVSRINIECAYDTIGMVEHTVAACEAIIAGSEFGEKVKFRIDIPVENADRFRSLLEGIGYGRVKITV